MSAKPQKTRPLFVIAVALVAAAVTVPLTFVWSKHMATPDKHHVLEQPLLVYSQSTPAQLGVLPAGTSIRYDKSFPEGFDRYQVYVNVEGGSWQLEPLDPPTLIDPLTGSVDDAADEGSTIDQERLRHVLQTLGVTRQELEAVLETYDAPKTDR